MLKKFALVIILIVVVFTTLIIITWGDEPEEVKATAFSINAEKVLIADKAGMMQVDFTIEPADTYPVNIALESDNSKVATATIGAIDKDGNPITAASQQAKKDKLIKDGDKDAAEKIIVPTNSAILTAKGYGECNINATIGEFSDSVKVIVADKRIALTFDDGAAPPTAKLIKALKDEDVKVTFFIVGQMSRKDDSHMESLKQAIIDGHEIGNHTYSHKAGADTLKKQLKKADNIIIKAGGKKSTLMRPPGGAVNRATKKCGKAIILWSHDTLDWKYRNVNKVYKNILKAKDGDNVLLHDLHQTSVNAAIKAIPELKKKGFYMVTITELFGDPKPNKIYKKGKPGKLKNTIIE